MGKGREGKEERKVGRKEESKAWKAKVAFRSSINLILGQEWGGEAGQDDVGAGRRVWGGRHSPGETQGGPEVKVSNKGGRLSTNLAPGFKVIT